MHVVSLIGWAEKSPLRFGTKFSDQVHQVRLWLEAENKAGDSGVQIQIPVRVMEM